MKAQHINKLVNVSGIVINSTKIVHKAIKIHVVCKHCQRPKEIDVFYLFRFNLELAGVTCHATAIPSTNKVKPGRNAQWTLMW